jgi:hypothetical protein
VQPAPADATDPGRLAADAETTALHQLNIAQLVDAAA